MSLTKPLPTERSAWAHLNAQMREPGNRLSKRSKLQLHLDLSTKGEATSMETSHAVAKMAQPVKVNFLLAAV